MFSQKTIILGNGFDLDLGLKTSYRHFINSPQYSELIESSKFIRDECNLFKIIEKDSKIETWGGVEASLLDYVKRFQSHIDEPTARMTYFFHSGLENGIAEYLRNISYDNIRTESCAAYLLRKMLGGGMFNYYSFNYTDVNKVFNTNSNCVKYIHGTLDGKNTILGVQDEAIQDRLAFVKKSHHFNYSSKDFISDMLNSKHILIFGHSMCLSDKEYFTTLFKDCKSPNHKCERITFIVHERSDVADIMSNIEKLSGLNMSAIQEIITIDYNFTSSFYFEDVKVTKKTIDDFFDPQGWFLMPSGRSV